MQLALIKPQSTAMISNGSYGASASAHRQYTRGMEQFTTS
jgi:hypothetical protein